MKTHSVQIDKSKNDKKEVTEPQMVHVSSEDNQDVRDDNVLYNPTTFASRDSYSLDSLPEERRRLFRTKQ